MTKNSLDQLKFNLTIIDDHDCILQGASVYLKKTFANANVLMFTEGNAFLNQLKNRQTDICIVDLELQDIGGIKIIKSLKTLQPDTKIIVYTMHDELWVIKSLMELNVDGIVQKTSPLETLKKAVEEVYKGEKYYCQKTKQEHNGNSAGSFILKETFNETHLEIIRLIALGLTSQQIAVKMGHTKNTIMSYKRDIFRKFGVNSAPELVVKAIAFGFIHKKDLV